MNRYLATLTTAMLVISVASAQRARMDSLERALARQPVENAARLRTLVALANTCSTIDPKRAFDLSQQAVALGHRLKDDIGLTEAWVSERWARYYLGLYSSCDSVEDLAMAAAARSGDPRSWAITHGVPHYVAGDPKGIRRAWMERSLHIADSIGDHALAAEILFWNGHKSYITRTPELLEQALSRYRALGDSSGVAMCLHSLASFEPYVSDPVRKQWCIDHATALFDLDGNVVWSLWLHTDHSAEATKRADYVTAVREGLVALDKANQLGMDVEVMYAQDALANSYRAMGDLRTALSYHLRSLDHPTDLQNHLAMLNQVGRVYGMLGMADSAFHYLNRAMAEASIERANEEPNAPRIWRYSEAEGFLAEVLATQGREAEAVGHFRSALEAHRREKAFQEEAWAALGYGGLLAHASDELLASIGLTATQARKKAQQELQRVLEVGRQMHLLKEQESALFELARLYELDGDLAKAFEYQKLHAAMKDSVLSSDKVKAVARLESAREEERRAAAVRAVQAEKDTATQAELSGQHVLRNWLVGGVFVIAMVAGIFFFQRNRVRKEKDASEAILYNVLPEEVAKEIKATGTARSREIDQVSVLFTDFKGFTELSASLPRQELMAEIDACFKVFDEISHRHGVEKIKTIGDAYMAAAGLKGVTRDAAVNTVLAALEMQTFIEARHAERNAQGLPAFRMRVGIHTGPVVAGIVGVKKFQYDIWGDTVNTASRMESSGEVGQVNISEATYALVRNAKKVNGEWSNANGGSTHSPTAIHHSPAFVFTPRGKVQAKGKGELEMYFVERSAT